MTFFKRMIDAIVSFFKNLFKRSKPAATTSPASQDEAPQPMVTKIVFTKPTLSSTAGMVNEFNPDDSQKEKIAEAPAPLSSESKIAILQAAATHDKTVIERMDAVNALVNQLPESQQREALALIKNDVTTRFANIKIQLNAVTQLAHLATNNLASKLYLTAWQIKDVWPAHSNEVLHTMNFNNTSIIPRLESFKSLANGHSAIVSIIDSIMKSYSICKVLLGIDAIRNESNHTAREKEMTLKQERTMADRRKARFEGNFGVENYEALAVEELVLDGAPKSGTLSSSI